MKKAILALASAAMLFLGCQPDVQVTSVTLDQTSVQVVEGGTVMLKATVKPADATNPAVTWSSSSPGVATVAPSGLVTAHTAGTAKITATAEDKSASCTVTVVPKTVAVTGVSLNKRTLTLEVGASETLVATVEPSNASDKTVTWSSSAASVAKVDQGGKVTAVAAGTATITATSGGKTADCTVTVNEGKVEVTGVSLNREYVDLETGQTFQLVATVQPANATDKTCNWWSSDQGVATVDASGLVKAVAAGSCWIECKAGGFIAKCDIIVSDPYVAPTGLTLDKTSVEIGVGETVDITATVTPANSSLQEVTWRSSSTSTASVAKTGSKTCTITGGRAGNATVTATIGELSATVEVKVVQTFNIKLQFTEKEMLVGNYLYLYPETDPYTYVPNDAWTYQSSDPQVVAVEQDGKLVGLAPGTSVVTVSYEGASATCTLTVKAVSGGSEGTGTEEWK